MKPSISEIQAWLVHRVQTAVSSKEPQITPQTLFAQLDLDSGAAIGVVAELEVWLGVELPVDVMLRHKSIESLAHYIASDFDAFPRL
jgi:acyl carrier protein